MESLTEAVHVGELAFRPDSLSDEVRSLEQQLRNLRIDMEAVVAVVCPVVT